MKQLKEININQLATILSDHYKNDVSIQGIDVAEPREQWNPVSFSIGCGGVLNLHIEVSHRKENVRG